MPMQLICTVYGFVINVSIVSTAWETYILLKLATQFGLIAEAVVCRKPDFAIILWLL